MIAIAIACDPKILIADEPTTSLDSVLKHEIIELLKRIQKTNKHECHFCFSRFKFGFRVYRQNSCIVQGRSCRVWKKF